MLTDYQKMTIRRAVEAAQDKDAEIRKLANGMHVPENEVRAALETPASEYSAAPRRGRPKSPEQGEGAQAGPCPEEPDAHGNPFDLIGCALAILDLLKTGLHVSIGTISSNPARGWATIGFEAGGEKYVLALRRPKVRRRTTK